jgi:hypothetical protein
MRGTISFRRFTRSNSPSDDATPTHLMDLSNPKAFRRNLSKTVFVVDKVTITYIEFAYIIVLSICLKWDLSRTAKASDFSMIYL